jgi:hypothetical protein
MVVDHTAQSVALLAEGRRERILAFRFAAQQRERQLRVVQFLQEKNR